MVDVYKRWEWDARSVGRSVVMASIATAVSCGSVSAVQRVEKVTYLWRRFEL